MGAVLNLHTAAALAVALLLGGMTFWSFAAAPALFRRLGRERAGEAVGAVFPLYYRTGTALAAIAGLLLYYRPAGWLMLGIAAVFAGLELWLRPALEAARPLRAADPAAARRFRRLHGLSMAVNLAQCLAVLGVFLALVQQ